jgi:hypothetical protein
MKFSVQKGGIGVPVEEKYPCVDSLVNDQIGPVSLGIVIGDKDVVAIGGRVVAYRWNFHLGISSSSFTNQNIGDEHVSFTSQWTRSSVTVAVDRFGRKISAVSIEIT